MEDATSSDILDLRTDSIETCNNSRRRKNIKHRLDEVDF